MRVFEAAERVGGRMAAMRRDGYVIDQGAEMLATRGYPATWRLLEEIGPGCADAPRIDASIAMWRGGRVHPDVGRPRGLLTGAGLSARARIDLLRFTAWTAARPAAFDPDHPEGTPLGEATVAELADRYHHELGDYLFHPITGGFFGWSAAGSAAAPFVTHLAAIGSTASWRTYRAGMDTLARHLATRAAVTTGAPVHRVRHVPEGVRLDLGDGQVTARSVVLAVPAPTAARLYPDAPCDEGPFLRACTYTPMLRVSCELDRPLAPRCGRPVYLLLVPPNENRELAAVTVDHNKAPDRVPRGRGLVTLLAAPEVTRELLEAPDDRIVDRLAAQAERYIPGLRAATVRSGVHRFRAGLPEATPQALRLRADFMRRPVRAVDYAGDWLMLRPSSEGAVRSAELTVPRIGTYLAQEAQTAGHASAGWEVGA